MDDPYKTFQSNILNLYVEHPEITRIWNRLDQIRGMMRNSQESDESPIHLVIEGKPGAGKTLSVKKYLKKNKGGTLVNDYGDEKDLKPVVYMTMPIPFTYKEFYNNILRGLGIPINLRDRDVGSIKNQAFQLLKELKVEMLIIDEIDYLLASTFVQKKAVMENIKDIANSADVCLVLVGTTAIEELRILNTQHIRRYPKTILDHFRLCDNKFLTFLNEVENQIQPGIKLNLGDPDSVMGPLLHDLTGGLVGWIKPILIEAFGLIKVFDEKFCDFNLLNDLNGDILQQAQINVIGEFAEDDMTRILNADDKI